MVLRAMVVLCAAAGCGRVGFAPRDDAPAVAANDAPADAALTTYRDVVLADNPLAYWRFDDNGVTAKDEMGQFDGTYMGGCTLTAGVLSGDASKALRSDGATCLIELAAGGLVFSGTSSFSVEMWVRERVIDTYQIYFMNETRTGPDPMDGYAVLMGPSGFYLERVVNATAEVTQPYMIPADQFVYLVTTYDGAFLHLFVDGLEIGTPKPQATIMPAYSAMPVIASFPAPGSQFIAGDIDELAIYGTSLTAAQVAMHRDYAINGPR